MESIKERISPIKSPNDPKEYLALVLQNGLKLLLVSDVKCDKAAASVSVGAGSMNDPDEIPGLAHLCEHLLSKEINGKPGYKPFSVFVAENGGMFNAFTSRDQTNFHFDVDPNVFEEAIQRFSKFFTESPKLTENDIDKEIGIIDSEHKSKMNKDAWRKMAVEASTAKKDHPFGKFSTGNTRTLSEVPKQKGINVLNAAFDFKSTYYSSGIMTVVVYGKSSLKHLEDLCVQLFCKVPITNVELPHWNEGPYGTDELQSRIDVVSVASIRDFYLIFPIDNTRPYYKTFPHGYITRLLGNRGPGSLYTFLYENQWVEFSYMNTTIPARGFGELSIGFQLTKTGINHIDDIIFHTFQYIKMLKTNGPQKYFWEEMQQILYLQFLYQEREVPIEFVQRTTNLMHVYPLIDILTVGSIIKEYEPTLIEKFLDYLCPENCRVLTVCRENEEKNVGEFLHDPWYDGKFTMHKIPDEQMMVWKTCETSDYFYLPKENKFIATNFELKLSESQVNPKNSPAVPKSISKIPLCKAWFQQDEQFKVAKGVAKLEIFSPLPLLDPVFYNLNQIWLISLKNILREEYYQATVAGSFHDIKPTMFGVEITVSGYSHKLLVLMEEIVSKITDSSVTVNDVEKHFRTVKERYTNGLLNSKNLPALNIATYYLSLLLREKRFSNEELLEALNDTTEENLRHFIKCFSFRAHFEWLVYGNFTQQEAEAHVLSSLNIIRKRWKTQPLVPSQISRLREICLSPGREFVFQVAPLKTGCACAVLFQIGVLNMRESVILEIIDQITYEPIFTQLRNNEQIGYIVRSSVRRSNGCQGLLIFVQGEKDPAFMGDRIKEALANIEERLATMSPAEFIQHRNAVRIRKAEQPKTMLALFNKLWNNEIYSRRYDFNRVHTELSTLDNVLQDEVISFFRQYLSRTSKMEKRILHVRLTANKANEDNQKRDPSLGLEMTFVKKHSTNSNNNLTIIEDIMAWKLQMTLHSITAQED